MGICFKKNNTITTLRIKFLPSVCADVLPDKITLYREVNKLKDGRIICFDYSNNNEVKIFKLIDNNFILDFKFSIENCDFGPSTMCEIEDNIILFSYYMLLLLIDIRNNKVKILQSISIARSAIVNILKLSNGLLGTNNSFDIIFYKYDEKIKKLEKVKGIISKERILYGLWETRDGSIIYFTKKDAFIYDKNKSLQTRIKFDKVFLGFNFIDEYIFASYSETKKYPFYFHIDIYSLKKFKVVQTLDVERFLDRIIKLNENLLIASDKTGNIHELKVDKNFKISKKNIFKAHDNDIKSLCKYDDNKILTISYDGSAKLWEIN